MTSADRTEAHVQERQHARQPGRARPTSVFDADLAEPAPGLEAREQRRDPDREAAPRPGGRRCLVPIPKPRAATGAMDVPVPPWRDDAVPSSRPVRAGLDPERPDGGH